MILSILHKKLLDNEKKNEFLKYLTNYCTFYADIFHIRKLKNIFPKRLIIWYYEQLCKSFNSFCNKYLIYLYLLQIKIFVKNLFQMIYLTQDVQYFKIINYFENIFLIFSFNDLSNFNFLIFFKFFFSSFNWKTESTFGFKKKKLCFFYQVLLSDIF